MIEVTESAIANIKEYLGQQNIESSVRIFLMSGGCSGPAWDWPLMRPRKTT